LNDLNVEIANKAWKLDSDTRAFKDPHLLKRHNDALMSARQENNMMKIDINVSNSRI